MIRADIPRYAYRESISRYAYRGISAHIPRRDLVIFNCIEVLLLMLLIAPPDYKVLMLSSAFMLPTLLLAVFW